MKYKIFSVVVLLLFASFTSVLTKPTERNAIVKTKHNVIPEVASLYHQLQSNSFSLPSFDCYSLALEGFCKFKEKGFFQKNILTIIDFSQSSNSKRLWIIDLNSNEILLNTLVAHGKNTGEEFAAKFSNKAQSFQSSLGFFATAEIYNGKHGASLKLDGLQKGLNDNARSRAVVMHGAAYVSEKFIRENHRLGRSLGCPAVPVALSDRIINMIKDKSCLFIYHPSKAEKFI